MNLKEIKINEIRDFTEYKHIFGSIVFFDNNNLHINNGTMAEYNTAPICNRIDINNYLLLLTKLFNEYDYFDLEIRTQMGILDTMLAEIQPFYDDLYSEVSSYSKESGINWAQDFDNDQDYRIAKNRLDVLVSIKTKIDQLLIELENKLDNPRKK